MNLNILTPRKALNKAFLKVKPNREDIEKFKANLAHLLSQINETESEELRKRGTDGGFLGKFPKNHRLSLFCPNPVIFSLRVFILYFYRTIV